MGGGGGCGGGVGDFGDLGGGGLGAGVDDEDVLALAPIGGHFGGELVGGGDIGFGEVELLELLGEERAGGVVLSGGVADGDDKVGGRGGHLAGGGMDGLTLGVEDFDGEGHLAEGVGGAGEAGVVAADGAFDAVECAFGDFGAGDHLAGGFEDGLVHGGVILAGSDEEVDLGKDAVGIGGVVMEERAAGGFGATDAFGLVSGGVGEGVGAGDIGVFEEQFDFLDSGESFDEAGLVEVEGAVDGFAVIDVAERFEFLLGFGGFHAVGGIEAGEGADAVGAFFGAEGFVVGVFEVGPGDGLFGDVVEVIGGVDLVGERGAIGGGEAEVSVVEFVGAVGGDCAEVAGGEVIEVLYIVGFGAGEVPEDFEAFEGGLGGFGDPAEEGGAVLF
ncbi:MAG: hypothetical protein RI897_3504 [Verrucomicrobiota bacterium]